MSPEPLSALDTQSTSIYSSDYEL